MALVALTVGGAMGQYIEGLAPALAKTAEVVTFLSYHSHEPRRRAGVADAQHLRPGPTKTQALLRLINPWAGIALVRDIVAANPDVVHLISGEGSPWAAILATRLAQAGIPLLVTLHDPTPHSGDLLGLLTQTVAYRTTLTQAAAVHVHARCLVDTVAARTHLAMDRIFVIPHPSFAGLFLPYVQDRVQKEEGTCLFFGRLEYYKGLDTLVQAMLLVNRSDPLFRLVIAGPGKLPFSLSRLTRKHQDIFEVHPRYHSEEEVATLFQRASLCILPYKDATQSSIPSIAAGFGVPLLATAVGGFREDVPFYGGMLVPPKDPFALARSVPQAAGQKPLNAAARSFAQTAHLFHDLYCSLQERSNAMPR